MGGVRKVFCLSGRKKYFAPAGGNKNNQQHPGAGLPVRGCCFSVRGCCFSAGGAGGAVFLSGGLFSGLEVFFGPERGPHVHECNFKTCEKMYQCLVKYRKMRYIYHVNVYV